ncbi:MAG TPA: energy transducer TonB [Candidatus Acidoferrum sp.]|nr:energy transducer TonB [Candidatus Acidoferrum sp.]
MVPVLTLVTWTSFLVVGVAGFFLRYDRPTAPKKSLPPVVAQLLQVELTQDPLPPITPSPQSPPLPQPPPMVQPIPMPSAPPTIAVAAPSPAIAFAVPIQAPAQVVAAAQASYRTPAVTPPAEAPPAAVPLPLTFGVGEGKQPAPEYPRLAMRQGQEGTVVVQFLVGADGRVVAAEAASRSPWPLLNEAAVRVVRRQWQFAPGAVRSYEVAIRFQLNKSNS